MTVHFERRGAGEPLVLLHGIGHHWRAWEPVLDLLAPSFDVIALDLPGFGRSPAVDGLPPGMPGAVMAVSAFLDELGMDRVHVAGNSLGGGIALELAATGRVASATALSPAGFATPAELRRALLTLGGMRAATFLPTPAIRAFYRSGFGRAAGFGQLVTRPGRLSVERAMADTLALRRGKGFRAVARAGRAYAYTGKPTVPVTVAWAEKDRILPLAQAARARELLPDAEHVVLDGCGHVPMSDDPDLVASVIRRTAARA
jgi:pimeloyl-ACP methyl ester carboxylesterase